MERDVLRSRWRDDRPTTTRATSCVAAGAAQPLGRKLDERVALFSVGLDTTAPGADIFHITAPGADSFHPQTSAKVDQP